MPNKKKPNWIQRMKTEDTTSIPIGTFTRGHSAEDIAKSLKQHSPDFQAAMAFLTMYINRSGKRLTKERLRQLEKAKHLLRVMYKRDDRIELYEHRKTRNKKVAMMHLEFDKNGQSHVGDMFIELIGLPDETIKKMSGYHQGMLEYIHEYEDFLKSYFETDDLVEIKKLLMKRYHDKKETPVWDVVDKKPVLVKSASLFSHEDKIMRLAKELVMSEFLMTGRGQ